ncbi:CMP/dCMP deaminase zinc-binding [Methylorubrum extorquens PA1]|nr:CMP/dCMP deaminase zinc-binding [Methylorubrum extorquens PA1]
MTSLEEKLDSFGYTAVIIRVTDLFSLLQDQLSLPVDLENTPLEDRYRSYIRYGDALREHFDDDSFLASLSIAKIINARRKIVAEKDLENPQKIAYIIRQFKRREEVELVRSVYGPLFFQISVYSKRSSRVDNLARKIAASHNSADLIRYRDAAEQLVRIDENEIEDRHGQRVSDVFHEADYIVNVDVNKDSVDNKETVNSQVGRFIDLVFGSNSISPSKSEYGLYTAKSASLRAIDLSRQVGAAIFTPDGEIISLGANEVPKSGGGTYWSDDKFDDRDYKRNQDSNEKRKRELLSELVEIMFDKDEREGALQNLAVRKSQFMDALEYGRIIHAEMSALCDAARLGRPLKSSRLYCTTFPCHMCAKHIVAAGVEEVVFLEPYPKSLASDLHGDSIDIEGQTRGEYEHFPATKFRHFHGVSPKRYRDLFESKRRKDEGGAFQRWRGGRRQAIVDIKLPVYLNLEEYIMQAVVITSLNKASVSLEVLSHHG